MCILVQPGHIHPIYSLAVHPDGALMASGDLGGVALLWDLRIGKVVLPLTGHSKGVMSASW